MSGIFQQSGGEVVSEVARIRQQVELEIQGMKCGFQGFTSTAKHQFIESRHRRLDQYMGQLGELVGEQEATNLVYDTYLQIMG